MDLPPKYSQKVALVTGASRGIGRACALALAKDGYDIVVNYCSDIDAAREVESLINQSGQKALCIEADVSREEAIDKMVKQVTDQWGHLDVLVNNAGISKIRPFAELTVEEWDRVLEVNLKGVMLCCQRVIPTMKTQGKGKIIMISSQAGETGGMFIGAHYSVSKAGVNCLTKYLAKQLAQFGILVNCVSAGLIETDMSATYPAELVEQLVSQIPLGRIGTPEDIAPAVVFLASQGSQYITGATIHVNGGVFIR